MVSGVYRALVWNFEGQNISALAAAWWDLLGCFAKSIYIF